MILILKLVLITYICVMGLKIVMSEGMLLEKLGTWLDDKSDESKAYQLFICPWRMSTLQSISAHAFAFGLGILPPQFTWELLIRWPLVIMGASLMSGLTWTIYETINSVKEKNELESEYYKTNDYLDDDTDEGHYSTYDEKRMSNNN